MNYLNSTYYLDFEHQNIQDLIKEFQTDELTEKEKAIGIYLKIRDGWRYNPYHIKFTKEAYRASTIMESKDGHCIDKAILLTTCLRGLKIPARLHLAKVKNHIAVERLIEKIGTNELTPHGMVDIFIGEKWLKSSPAFNAALCEKCNVATLDFDGENDSIFQEFDKEGATFMEYLEDYGHFEDVPFDFMMKNMKDHYGQFFPNYGETEEMKIL